jgi:hypothetical protein
MMEPCPSGSVITGAPNCAPSATTRSRAYTVIGVSDVQRAFSISVTEHRSQYRSHTQSREYTILSSMLVLSSGIRPNRCERNSSGITDVLISISTRSIAVPASRQPTIPISCAEGRVYRLWGSRPSSLVAMSSRNCARQIHVRGHCATAERATNARSQLESAICACFESASLMVI